MNVRQRQSLFLLLTFCAAAVVGCGDLTTLPAHTPIGKANETPAAATTTKQDVPETAAESAPPPTAGEPAPDAYVENQAMFVADTAAADATAPSDVASRRSPPADWPLFRGNAQSTGVASGDLPEQLDIVWRYRVDKGAFEGTPAIVGDTVYIGDLDGKVYALSLDKGELRWEFTAEDSGFLASPSVHDGRLFIGDYNGFFFCLDAKSGKKLWMFETEAEINSSANFYQGNVLVGSQDASLYCLDGPSGNLKWKLTVEDQIRCTPTVAGNRTFLAGCDGRLHVVDLDKGEEVAAVDIQSPTGNTPAVVKDMVFFGTEAGTFFGINWRQAKIIWQYESEGSMSYRSSAAATDRLVIVGGRNKRVHAFDPAKGNIVWEYAAKTRIDSSPVVVGQRVFVATSGGRLYALSLAEGKQLWQYEAGGGFIGSPAVAGQRLVIANDEGVVYCFGGKGRP
jgi:outer membrane protein assembly factor BamB